MIELKTQKLEFLVGWSSRGGEESPRAPLLPAVSARLQQGFATIRLPVRHEQGQVSPTAARD